MSELLNLLRQLEEPNTSNDKVKELFSYRDDLDGSAITSYFVKRLKNAKISPDRLITFLKNIGEEHIKHISISAKLNEIIIWLYYKNFNKEYLYYVLDNDPRKVRPLRKDLTDYLAGLIVNDALYYIDDIASNSKYRKVDLCSFVIESFSDVAQGQIRSMMFLNELKLELINDLLINTLLNGYPILDRIVEQLTYEKVFRYVQDHLNDKNGLCEAIQHTPISITFLNYPALRECLFQRHKDIPNTIKSIFDRAVQEEHVYLLLEMGEVYDRKEILKALISSASRGGSRDLIDKFIINNRKYEDMSIFVPFM